MPHTTPIVNTDHELIAIVVVVVVSVTSVSIVTSRVVSSFTVNITLFSRPQPFLVAMASEAFPPPPLRQRDSAMSRCSGDYASATPLPPGSKSDCLRLAGLDRQSAPLHSAVMRSAAPHNHSAPSRDGSSSPSHAVQPLGDSTLGLATVVKGTTKHCRQH